MAKSKDNAKGSSEELSLFAEMKKLAKRTNQRILRLERFTGLTDSFATKQLYDYLSASTLNLITEKGRVAVRKSLTETQMRASINAMKRFLSDKTSTVKGLKIYGKQVTEDAGIPLSWNQINTYFQSQKGYEWIYDYLEPSSFWNFARECIKKNWSQQTFIEKIMPYLSDKRLDESLTIDLIALYDYAQGVKL